MTKKQELKSINEILAVGKQHVKIKRETHSDEEWVEIVGVTSKGICLAVNRRNSIDYVGDLDHICWQVYQEPKKKVKKYLWNFKFSNKKWHLDQEYMTEERVKEYATDVGTLKYKKSELPFIEVEED